MNQSARFGLPHLLLFALTTSMASGALLTVLLGDDAFFGLVSICLGTVVLTSLTAHDLRRASDQATPRLFRRFQVALVICIAASCFPWESLEAGGADAQLGYLLLALTAFSPVVLFVLPLLLPLVLYFILIAPVIRD